MFENDVYLWIHRCLAEEGEVSEEEVQEEFGTDSDEYQFASEYLDRLTRQDILSLENGSFIVSDVSQERRACYRLVGASDETVDLPDDFVYEPVINVPTKVRNSWEEYAKDSGISPGVTIQSALSAVIDEADETLSISAPFFELDGLNAINESFTDAAHRGVNIRILVRGTQVPQPRKYSQNRRRKALIEAIDRFEQASDSESTIEIHDYHHLIGGENPKLDRSIHAKLAVADSDLAYVGSGEIRDSSMNLNVEAGYLIADTVDVTQWRVFFDFLWELSDEVHREELSD